MTDTNPTNHQHPENGPPTTVLQRQEALANIAGLAEHVSRNGAWVIHLGGSVPDHAEAVVPLLRLLVAQAATQLKALTDIDREARVLGPLAAQVFDSAGEVRS